ncbi:hypothetical protein BJX99DRAFT_246273 [Aspergillus californicus]
MAQVCKPTFLLRDPTQRLQHNKNRNVQKSHNKHFQTALPEPSPFIDRFFALPLEIRLEVYRHLLVRPCKFDTFHRIGCDEYPFIEPWTDTFRNSDKCLRCAECRPQAFRFGHYELTSDSPARSQWARPKKNPFLCDDCYPDKQIEFGMERSPCLTLIKCLCPRRQDLGVLLINRRINEEASPVFWKENTFAFESGRVLSEFLEEIGTQKRSMIRSIAFLSPGEDSMESEEVPPCWPLLRQCPGLRELELDSEFLEDYSFVHELSTVRVPKVRFVQKPDYETYSRAVGDRCTWPRAAYRSSYSNPLADALCAAMMHGIVDDEHLRTLFLETSRPDEDSD